MNRTQLQQLARTRLLDAAILLAGQRWSAAYYLTGYVVECGFKSCVLRYLDDTGMLFKDRKYLRSLADCWTHDLVELSKLAGLEADLGVACGANPALGRYWGITKDWNETSRYEEKSEVEARTLYEAVSHNPDGVLQWIQSRW